MKIFKIRCTIFFTILLLILSILDLFSQTFCPPISNGVHRNDQPPGCNICSQGTYTGSTGGYTPELIPIETPCNIENSQWFNFLSKKSQDFKVKIQAYSCNQGKGVEAVVFDKNFKPVSNCFLERPINGASFMTVSTLRPYEKYHLMIDGIDGDICGLRIEFLQGFYSGETTSHALICPGGCVQFNDSCYTESIKTPCSDIGPLNITTADTGRFEIKYFIDTFINSFALDWKTVIGADSYDVLLNDSLISEQKHSSYLLPLANLQDSLNVKVIPKNDLGCNFYHAELNYPSDNLTSGILHKKTEVKISVSPNPNQGYFQIETDFKIEKIEIFDLSGRQIKTNWKSSSPNSGTIDYSNSKPGIHFLKIYSGDQIFIRKVVFY